MNAVHRLAAALALFTALGASAQTDWAKVEVKAVPVTDTIHMLTGAGGNIGLCVGEDAVFVIDDQYAPLSEKILAAIGRITPKPVRFVLNTHWHGDHTGGNESFGKAGAIIVAHENVRKRLGTEQFIEAYNHRTPPSPKGALPVVTFADGVSFHLNGDEIRAIHVPRAHTDGDTIVHFLRSDVIHMGDVYLAGMFPFIDSSSGGTVEGTLAAYDRILAIAGDKTRIIPGHGPLSNKAEMKAHRDMIADVSEKVRDMVRAGRKLEEITAANLTAPYDERYSKGWIKGARFVELLAKDMIRR